MFGYRDGGRLDSGSQRLVNLKGTEAAIFPSSQSPASFVIVKRDQIFDAATLRTTRAGREGIRELKAWC